MTSPEPTPVIAAPAPYADDDVAEEIIPAQGGLDGLEADDFNDTDSALGSISSHTGSSTKSVASSILKAREENGRTYHSYKEGKYVFPNDEDEKERLDLQHHLFLLTYDGKLNLCPFDKKKAIHRVLDVGTGTGIWAMDYADEHPESQVIGIDLSAIQPDFVPPNLYFEIDDIEEDWTWNTPFDFVHARMMTGAMADWPRFFQQAYDNTTPGGYIEVSDILLHPKCNDGTLLLDSAISRWAGLMIEASVKGGRSLASPTNYQKWMQDAGYIDVMVRPHIWPSNTWPKDLKYREIGQWQMANTLDGLNAFSMALFTRNLGWTSEQVEAYLVDVRNETKNTSIHAYYPIYCVYGRKPL